MRTLQPDNLLKSLPAPPTPLLIKHFNIRNSSYKCTQYDKQAMTSKPLLRKHQKHFSCECSPESSPLQVKKQQLKDRRRQLITSNLRQQKVKFKQKTDCFNTAYLDRLKVVRQTMNWVRYNIEVGIYALVGRIKKQLNWQLLQQKEYQKIKPELVTINKCLQQIQKYSPAISSLTLHTPAFNNHFIVLATEKWAEEKSTKNTVQKCTFKDNPKVTKTAKFQAKKFKQAVQNLSSALCLLSRKITLQKQNQLIKQFFQQEPLKPKSNDNKNYISPQKLTILYEIMQINDRRCSMLNELADRLVEIDHFKLNFKLTEDHLKQLQAFNLPREVELTQDKPKDEEIIKLSQTVQSILNTQIESKHQNVVKSKKALKASAFNNQSHKDQPKKVRIATKSSKSFRASIQLMIEDIHAALSPPNIKGESCKYVAKSKNRLLYPTNHQVKFQPEIIEQPKIHFYQPKVIKKKQVIKHKPKKALAFANEICGGAAKSDMKSSKSILLKKKSKQAKEGGSQCTILSSSKVIQIKSIKSLRSMRSITSNGSGESSKLFGRSLKTQHQIKFLNGRSRKISGIRLYRSRIFKFNQDFTNACDQSDLLNFATQFMDQSSLNSSEELMSSMSNVLSQQSKENLATKTKESTSKVIASRSKIGRKAAAQLPDANLIRLKKKQNPNLFHRKPKKAMGMKELKDDRSNAIKNFLTLCTQIKSGKHIIQKKKLFYQHFHRLYQSKLIPENLYHKYRKYFQQNTNREKSTVLKIATESEEHQARRIGGNPYESLVSLRKQISQNRRLGQTNKYYYNFDEFKSQQQEIEKTKQKAFKDQQFFNIKSYTDQKEVYQDPMRRTMQHFNGRYISREDKLFQKEI